MYRHLLREMTAPPLFATVIARTHHTSATAVVSSPWPPTNQTPAWTHSLPADSGHLLCLHLLSRRLLGTRMRTWLCGIPQAPKPWPTTETASLLPWWTDKATRLSETLQYHPDQGHHQHLHCLQSLVARPAQSLCQPTRQSPQRTPFP